MASRRASSDFGSTWWGQAWTEALEGVAAGRGGRLQAGRRLARQQRHEDLRIEPGAITAFINDQSGVTGKDETHEVTVGVRALRDDEWDAVLGAIAGRAARAAALVDGELEPGIIDDAAAVEVDLLPRPRDIRTVCTCPDEVEPCAHAAAASYLFAQAIDVDPFVLLLVRGRRRDQVLEGVRSRRQNGVPEGSETGDLHDSPAPSDGVDAATAWARTPDHLPLIPVPPDRPGRPAPWPSDPPAHAPFDAVGLRTLVEDAAHRAWEILAGGRETGLDLDERTDLARRAAISTATARDELSVRADVPLVELESLATAWELGHIDAVRATDEPKWNPPPLEMAKARDIVLDSGLTERRRIHLSGNRISAAGEWQFRRSRDGHWYLFNRERGRWTLEAGPEPDIDDLLDVALGR